MTKIDAIGIPDTKLCREIGELVRDTEPDDSLRRMAERFGLLPMPGLG